MIQHVQDDVRQSRVARNGHAVLLRDGDTVEGPSTVNLKKRARSGLFKSTSVSLLRFIGCKVPWLLVSRDALPASRQVCRPALSDFFTHRGFLRGNAAVVRRLEAAKGEWPSIVSSSSTGAANTLADVTSARPTNYARTADPPCRPPHHTRNVRGKYWRLSQPAGPTRFFFAPSFLVGGSV